MAAAIIGTLLLQHGGIAIFAGSVLALLMHRGIVRYAPTALAVLAVAAMLVASVLRLELAPHISLLAVMTLPVIAVAASRRSVPTTVLAWMPLRHVGRLSYAIYLWHWPITWYLNTEVAGIPLPLRGVIVVVASSVAALASWHLVESRYGGDHGRRAAADRKKAAGARLAGSPAPVGT